MGKLAATQDESFTALMNRPSDEEMVGTFVIDSERLA